MDSNGISLFFSTEAICAGLDITIVQDNRDLVTPVLLTEGEIPYGESASFNCTILGANPEMFTRSQKCVYDVTVKRYRLVGDSLECRSK